MFCLQFAEQKFTVSRYYFLDNHLLPQLRCVGSHPSLLTTSALPLHLQPPLNQALLCQGCSLKRFILSRQTRQRLCRAVMITVGSHYLKSRVTCPKPPLEFGTLNTFTVKFPRAAPRSTRSPAARRDAAPFVRRMGKLL